MTPVVVDTNVLVAGLLTADPGAPTLAIVNAMVSGQLRHLLSEALLAEYRQVLLRPKIAARHGLSEENVDALLVEIVAGGAMRSPPPTSSRAPDPGDQHLFELLLETDDALLITGDRLLLRAGRAHTLRIRTPAEFRTAWSRW
jgi:putative PIN family toxin of toxin-antitoxin system